MRSCWRRGRTATHPSAPVRSRAPRRAPTWGRATDARSVARLRPQRRQHDRTDRCGGIDGRTAGPAAVERVHAGRGTDLVNTDAACITAPGALPSQLTQKRIVHSRQVSLLRRCAGNATCRPPRQTPTTATGDGPLTTDRVAASTGGTTATPPSPMTSRGAWGSDLATTIVDLSTLEQVIPPS
jgi:hypothetical protein